MPTENPSEIVPLKLADGSTVQVEVRPLGGEENVALGELSFDGLSDSIAAIAQSLSSCLAKVKPQSAEIEFGIEAAVESGRLTALLVKGSGKANLKIKLGWHQ
jgi:hypothetical protein